MNRRPIMMCCSASSLHAPCLIAFPGARGPYEGPNGPRSQSARGYVRSDPTAARFESKPSHVSFRNGDPLRATRGLAFAVPRTPACHPACRAAADPGSLLRPLTLCPAAQLRRVAPSLLFIRQRCDVSNTPAVRRTTRPRGTVSRTVNQENDGKPRALAPQISTDVALVADG